MCNVIATCSGFPQDGCVRNDLGTCKEEGGGKNGEREKGRNSECFFGGEGGVEDRRGT